MVINKNASIVLDHIYKNGHLADKNMRITYLSADFVSSVISSKDKLLKLLSPSIIDRSECVGTYIVSGNVVVFQYDKPSLSVLVEAIDYSDFQPVTDEKELQIIELFILLCVLFKKYAEIETKVLAPNSKEGKNIKCKYINKTDYDITYLNSTWFTNLVKSDAFKVSGHFRLQPCNDENGLPTKKLIWINDFVKSGYTSPARKLKESIS